MIKDGSLFSSGGVTESTRSIHTPSSFARRNLLYIQEVGRLKSLSPHRCIREGLDSYLFIIVLEGEGEFFVKGGSCHVTIGDCVLIDCTEHYEHISSEENAWTLAWVHFNGQAAEGYYELFKRYNKINVFHTECVDAWDNVIGRLLELQNSKGILAELVSGELLTHLLNEIVQTVMNIEMESEEDELQEINILREYLNQNYAASTVLDQIEKHAERPLCDLDRNFVRYIGISMEDYVWNRRFNAAKELLRFTIKPIEDVVRESGLGDIVTMQRLFRENENVSAEEYRMKWAQWIK